MRAVCHFCFSFCREQQTKLDRLNAALDLDYRRIQVRALCCYRAAVRVMPIRPSSLCPPVAVCCLLVSAGSFTPFRACLSRAQDQMMGMNMLGKSELVSPPCHGRERTCVIALRRRNCCGR